ncbi:YkvA family protein [Arenimonas soli]|nr:YkvA family protein [Arenimonas soli]
MLSTFHDPLALRLPPESPDSRRRHVGDLALEETAVARFNALLAQLDPNAPRVTADQLVTLARWLQEQPRERAVAILAERLRRAEHLRRMLNDGDWELDAELRERSRLLISYLHEVNDLIPDDLPLVGHLDDALLVELAWPAFRDQSLDYGDFCAFRKQEQPRGTAAERRLAWESTRLAELALLQQRRDVRSRPYAGGQPLQALFRVS